MLKAVIFDMDGVLINTEPFHYEIWRKTLEKRGLEIDYEHYKGCIGSTVGYLLDIIQDAYGVDFHGDEELVQEMRAIKDQMVEESGIPRIPGVPEMLRRVREKGYIMAVASSSPQIYIERQMKALGVADCFDLLFSGERVENPKPAPDTFLRAAEKLGVQPEECLVVEDSFNGCKAAKAAGMFCVGYYNPDSGDQDLSVADAVIADYEMLDGDMLQYIYEHTDRPSQE